MTSRRLAFLCIGLLATSLVLAQTPMESARSDTATHQMGPQPTQTMPINAYTDRAPGNTVVSAGARDVGVSGASCPAGYLAGQDQVGNTWLYSDLHATVLDELAIVRTDRVTSESFPPPGGWASQQPIDIVTWHATYITDASDGCNKDTPVHHFKIEFYNDDGTGKPNCASPVYSWSLVPDIATRVGSGTLNFGGVITADEWEFTALLPTSVNMSSGHFSIKGDGSLTDCYVLLGPSASTEGDDRTWRWYNSPTPCYIWSSNTPGASSPYDIQYCFGRAIPGACCFDCGASCTYSNDFICGLQGGRFAQGVQCANMVPACGAALGACCTDVGGCTLTTCANCLAATQACCLPDDSCIDATVIDCAQHAGTAKGAGTVCATTDCAPPAYCIGDMNCDGTVGFGDINPFVLYLSNFANWQLAYPGCSSQNGDINCDGSYPSFGDINPFVGLLSTNPIPQCPHTCPAPPPAPRAQGPVWGGAGTTCADPNDPTYGCCVVVAGTPKENETQNCIDDVFNAGCNADTPVFSTLPGLSTPIYGESGTFVSGGQIRDMDWYSYTSVVPSIYTVTVRAEFPPVIYVVHDDNPTPVCTNNWTADLPIGGEGCVDVVLVTHCLPAGKYYFVVAPNTFTGVACGADYKLTVDAANCEPCAIICDDPNAVAEQSACNDITDPNDPGYVNDENGGCNKDPNFPEDPASFELLPLVFGEPYTVCGTVWATEGTRDLDWFRFTFTQRFALQWIIDAEMPVRATLLFNVINGVNYPPPDCNTTYVYPNALAGPCAELDFDGTGILYQAGTYWFLVSPQADADNGLWYGYPCGKGNPYQDYKITFVATAPTCPDPCTDPAFTPTLTEGEPVCGPGYNDTTNSGCDVADPNVPGPRKPILAIDTTGLNYDYCSSGGAWLNDPNDLDSVAFDYDWYEFTTPTTPANGRWYIYLYSEFPTTWEIWPANNCAAGPIEGLEMPPCYYTSVRPAQCYPANTTYWLRVFPTDASPACGGSDYYLGMFNFGGCSPCSINCAGATDNDNPCDDVNDYDTNFGCNGDPNGTYIPTAFLAYSVGGTYCGRSYGTEILVAGDLLGYYDPDWFRITLGAVTNLRLRVQAEFPAFVGLYYAGTNPANPSCATYEAETSVGEVSLLAACSGTTPTNINFPGLAAGVYVGVIYPIDYFGNLLTKYYPCGTYNDYKIIVTTYVP